MRYRVLIRSEYLFGYSATVWQGSHHLAQMTTWTRRGARRSARRYIKSQQTRPTIEYIDYH